MADPEREHLLDELGIVMARAAVDRLFEQQSNFPAHGEVHHRPVDGDEHGLKQRGPQVDFGPRPRPGRPRP